MTDKPHIFNLRADAFKKILLGALAGGIGMGVIFYFVFRTADNLLNMMLLGFWIGAIIMISGLYEHYSGTYILGGLIGTLVSGALLAINFEDPFLIGFAPIGGLLGALIVVLPEDDW